MNRKNFNRIIVITLLIQLCLAGGCEDVSAAKNPPKPNPQAAEQKTQQDNHLDEVLGRLNESAANLKTYQCRIEYLFQQPLFDSQTLRTGKMYYLRNAEDSLLRINFETIQQDEQPQEKYIEQYVFDGVWLTRIDYQLKQIKMYQLIDPNDLSENQSIDAFDLITEHLPIVGFTRTDKLKKDFDIELIETKTSDADAPAKLQMKVKPDSIYAENYTSIDFVIDKKFSLPASITAFSVEDDFYQFKFIEPKVNEKLDREIFELKIPDGFPPPEINPLQKKSD